MEARVSCAETHLASNFSMGVSILVLHSYIDLPV